MWRTQTAVFSTMPAKQLHWLLAQLTCAVIRARVALSSNGPWPCAAPEVLSLPAEPCCLTMGLQLQDSAT